MRVYTITGFKGRYPVGTAAVVRAANKLAAVEALESALTSQGLRQTINPDDLQELVMRTGRTSGSEVRVLCNGDY